jgi:hypothetical protein
LQFEQQIPTKQRRQGSRVASSRHSRGLASRAREQSGGLGSFAPGPRDPQHAAIWSEIKGEEFTLPAETPLTLASYAAGEPKRAFIEPVAVGQELPSMPLFLQPEFYVLVPLETTYNSAFEAVPRRWQDALNPL